MNNFKNCFLLLFFIFPQIIYSQNTGDVKTRITVSDLTKIKQISNLEVSPDGKSAIYALKTIEPNAENKLEFDYKTQLWLTDFTTTKPITTGSENTANFSFSPDGKKIALLRNVKGKSQIFTMNLNGGEAMQLTDYKYSIGSLKWASDGKKLLFTSSLKLSEIIADSVLNPKKLYPEWSAEKPGFSNNSQLKIDKKIKPNPDGTLEEIRAYLSQNETDKKAKVINRLNFQGEATTEPEMSFNQLLMVDAADGQKITPLITGFRSVQNPVWSISGQGIYFRHLLTLSNTLTVNKIEAFFIMI